MSGNNSNVLHHENLFGAKRLGALGCFSETKILNSFTDELYRRESIITLML